MKTYFEKFPTITYPYTDNSGKKIEKEQKKGSILFRAEVIHGYHGKNEH